jgi:hypothetical protein
VTDLLTSVLNLVDTYASEYEYDVSHTGESGTRSDIARKSLKNFLVDIIKDAERYRFLRDRNHENYHSAAPLSKLVLSYNEDLDLNDVTAKQWIEDLLPGNFEDVDEQELQAMKDTNSIWELVFYGAEGHGSWGEVGSTLDYVVDRMTPTSI